MAKYRQIRIAPPEWSWMETRDGRDWLTEVSWDADALELDFTEGPTGRARDFESGGCSRSAKIFLRQGPPSFADPPDDVRESIRYCVASSLGRSHGQRQDRG